MRAAAVIGLAALWWSVTAPDQAPGTLALADRYLRGEYDAVLTDLQGYSSLNGLVNDLAANGGAWIDREGPQSAARRRLTLATLALEAARIGQPKEWKAESRTPDYAGSARMVEWKAPPRLIEWACRLFRAAGPPAPAERVWQLAAVSVAERAGDFEFLHSDGLTLWNPKDEIDHLIHVRARFPAEPRFKLALGIAAALRPPPLADLLERSLRAQAVFGSLRDDVDVGAEAMLRLGIEASTTGNDDGAVRLFELAEQRTRDPWIVYHARLQKSRALERRGKAAEAAAARAAARAVRPEASLDLSQADRELRAADDRFWPILIARLRAEVNPVPESDPAPMLKPPALRLPPAPPGGVTPAWLVAAFDAGQEDQMFESLLRSRNLAGVIKQVAAAPNPWPDRPRQEALYVLAVAHAGLRGDRAAVEETAQWLTSYDTFIRHPLGADAFECTWYLAEVALLEGSTDPALTMPFVARARARCPSSPRLVLATALVIDQRWPVAAVAPAPSAPIGSSSPNPLRFMQPIQSHILEVTAAYDEAMALPAVSVEARVRAARFYHRIGRDDRAIALTANLEGAPAAPSVIYVGQLVRGQALGAAGDLEAAAASFRAALVTWPPAQSPRVGLLTLALDQGDVAEAMRLADTIQTAPHTNFDPWWLYWQGDYMNYVAIDARLRSLAR